MKSGHPLRRQSSGFTLVEAIVVGVIIAILAAVTVPNYLGYVTNQKIATCKSIAETAAVSAHAIWRRTGNNPDAAAVNSSLFLPNSGNYTIDVVGNSIVVTDNSASVSATVPFRPDN